MSRLNWKPEKSSSDPLYLQIADYIKQKILTENGRLARNFLHREC